MIPINYVETPAFSRMLGLFRSDVPLRGCTRSGQWAGVRKHHLESFPSCAACGRQDRPQEVHHIVPVHFDRTMELDPTNLITLCADRCHIIFGHLFNFRYMNPNVVQDCQEMLAQVLKARQLYGVARGLGTEDSDE